MNPALPVQLNFNIDPAAMTAEALGEYVARVFATLTAELTTSAGAPAGSPGHVVGLDKQLGRLADHAPTFAPRLKRLHAELIALGYVPTLPNSKGDQLPSYISYIDPVSGINLGNMNSEKFYVMRGALRDPLVATAHFGADKRYAHCHLTSESAVDAVLKVAKDEKMTPTA